VIDWAPDRFRMNLIVMVGSLARSEAVSFLLENDVAIHRVIVPHGEAYGQLKERLAALGCDVVSAKKEAVLGVLLESAPSVVLCVGWPHLFPEQIVKGPWLLLNSHPTLLPKFRGPNPWYEIIAKEERECGVTIHQIDAGVDTGPIVHQESFPLTKFDTYRSLRAKVLALEPTAIYRAICAVMADTFTLRPQDESLASEYPKKRKPEDSQIDPALPLIDLIPKIRASDPETFPAFCYYNGEKVCIKLWRPHRSSGDHPDSV